MYELPHIRSEKSRRSPTEFHYFEVQEMKSKFLLCRRQRKVLSVGLEVLYEEVNERLRSSVNHAC